MLNANIKLINDNRVNINMGASGMIAKKHTKSKIIRYVIDKWHTRDYTSVIGVFLKY